MNTQWKSEKWVLASGNKGKIREIQAVLAPFDIILVPQTELGVEEVPETGTTFVENAIIKARHASEVTGLPALADDSGIVIEALNGAPGIISARYSGENATDQSNIEKCLQAMQTIPYGQRGAHYTCVLVRMSSADDPSPWICEGKWAGTITKEPRGNLGFGYDPIFQIAGSAQTAAECEPVLKNQISHRGLALKSLITHLASRS